MDDAGVTAHRTVETLQVAVNDECQVVQVVQRRMLNGTTGFRLVHFAVTEEGPNVLLGSVLDAAVVEIAVKTGLVDSVNWSQPHRHRRELPELRHAMRVRVGGKAIALTEGDFLTETVEVLFGQAPL